MIAPIPTGKLYSSTKADPRNQDYPAGTGGILQFRIFCALWGIASLFHMAHSSVFDRQLNLALLTVAAFFAIFRPSFTSFLLLIILQVFDALFRMPITTNHWIFTAFVNLTIIHTLLFLFIRERSFRISEDQFFRTFAPLVRIEVIILYFFAVFHKLNSGFFDPATSCATDLLVAQNAGQVIDLTENIFLANAYFTLFVELSIPVLLCFRQTRNAGVIVGLLFHCILSYSTYNAFYDFSSVMFAAYFLFLTPAFGLNISRRFQRLKESVSMRFQKFSFARLGFILCIGLVLFALLAVLNRPLNSYRSVHLYFFWTVYSLLFAACVMMHVLTPGSSARIKESIFRWAHWSLLIIPIVVFINGTLPYLGLKTENSYAMFSNLRTEGGRTNHFIIPASTQIFDYQKEIVQIVSSTDSVLQRLALDNKALVLFEFKNYVNEQKPQRVEYLFNGQQRVFIKGDSESQQALGKNPYVLRKLMKFRPFSVEGPQPCAH